MPALIACGAEWHRRLGRRPDEAPNCLTFVCWATLWCAALLGPAVSSAENCGPGTHSDDPLGYAWRGGFCEGRCSEDVAVETVELLSLHLGDLSDPIRGVETPLVWAGSDRRPEGSEDWLTIRSADLDVCYRLDSSLVPTFGSFLWAQGVVAVLGPDPGTLGVTVVRNLGDEPASVVPVRWSQSGPGGLSSRWLIQVAVRQVTANWRALEKGVTDGPAAQWKGYVPGGEVLELKLDPPPSPGSWELELLASSAAGEPVAHTVRVSWPEDG